MDAWKIADPIAQSDIHHSPDYVLVDGHTGHGTMFDFSVVETPTRATEVTRARYVSNES